MANITASLVKELRQKSGVGMMDCKKALVEADGDMERAMDILKEKGMAKAAKKSGRIAAEGAVVTEINGKKGLMLEVNCETDFAGKSEDFLNVATELKKYFFENAKEENEVVEMTESYDEKVEEIVHNAIAKIGENIKPRRFVKYNVSDNSMIHSYVHMGGKIGVMLEVEAEDASVLEKDELKQMADGIAMQIASMNPDCVDVKDFSQEKIAKEKEVFLVQVKEMGKPEKIAEKIVEGKIRKFVSENTLLEQEFVMDSDKKVKDYVKDVAKTLGTKLTIKKFDRFELGEGIEKKEENFAEEVAAQIK